MGNLTQEEKVVSEERSGFAPKPGHDIVVFELIDHGLKNPKLVQEGAPFRPERKGLFAKELEYASYAVSNNKHLRYTFTNRFNHMSVGHSFDLTFTLGFSVGDPKLLVTKLQSDPLRQLRDETQRLVGGAVATLRWEKIKESKLKDNSRAISQEATQGKVGELTSFAADFGFLLKEINLLLNLTSDDAEPLVAEANRERKTEVAEIQQRAETGEISRELQLGVQRQKLAEQKQIYENEILLLKQKAAVQGGALDAVKQAFTNIGNDTRTPEALLHGVDLVARTFGPMNPTGPARSVLSPGFQPSPGLLGPATQEGHGLEGLIKEALLHFGSTATHPNDRQLLADILHWIVENYLGKAADETLLAHYRERLSESIKSAGASGEPYFFLKRVLDDKELSRQLSER